MSEQDPVAGSHAAFVELLAGYVDDELTPEERERVEAHVPNCATCRAELRAQTVIRNRLMKESESSAASELAGRVLAQIAITPSAETDPGMRTSRRQLLLAWSGWAAAAAVGGFAVWLNQKKSGGMSMAMGPTGAVTLDQAPGPVPADILSSFRQINEAELPAGTDLAQLRRELQFSVPRLEAPHMRLISAWITRVYGEPAAALAYRCHDRLVMQYVVSERQFFRQAQVRNAIARQGLYATAAGPLTTVAWPGTDNGSFLVGEFSASDLVAMRS
ncbi:MAG: zf-HC2 domain-containing protein [Gemmatimonadota bacterium]